MTQINSKATILIVDDDNTVRLALRKVLERQGYEIIEASGGQEALERLGQYNIRLVITDVYMPQISGIDLLTEIKSRNNRIPVIIVTGKASVEAAVECMKIGASDYISKPFTLSLIEETVHKIIARTGQSNSPSNTTLIKDLPTFMTDYDVMETLGEGNMGIVYLVEKLVKEKRQKFAVKIFKGYDFTPEAKDKLRKRFMHEAKAASTVQHPNVIGIVEFGLDDNVLVNYIVMEYVDGKSLKQYIDEKILLTYKQKCHILCQIAKALGAIHKHGICHRDIKPANILVADNLNTKVTDFGIARLPDSMLTQKNDLLGSPGYMAPESFESSKVDCRADIFSFGITAYEFLAGIHPFISENCVKTCYLIRNNKHAGINEIDPGFPDRLQMILDKMLNKSPDERYQSADDLYADLSKLIINL